MNSRKVQTEEAFVGFSRFTRERMFGEFAAYVFVTMIFFDFYIVADLRISDIVLFLTFMVLVFRVGGSKLKIPMDPILILLVFWIMSWSHGFLTLHYLDFPRETALYKYWGYGGKLVSYILIIIVISNLRRSFLTKIITGIQVAVFVRLIYVLLLVFSSGDFYRVVITGKNTNVDGFLAVLMLFYSALVASKNRLMLTIRYSSFVMSVVYLFFTAARAAFFASLSILLIFFLSLSIRRLFGRGILIRGHSIRVRSTVIILLLLGVFLVTGVTLNFDLPDMLQDISLNANRIREAAALMEDSSFYHRIRIQWPDIIDFWKRSPTTLLVGNGYGTLDRSDGLYVKLLAETGLVGLALFLISIASASIKASRKPQTRFDILFALTTMCFVLIGLTNEVFYVYRAMEIYILFYALSLNYMERSSDEDSSCS